MKIDLKHFISNTCCNSCQSFYDLYVETNVRIRSKLGMKEVIVRRQLGHCCDWCAGLAGTYDAYDAPDDIYKRHRNCRCMVTYKTDGKGYQDAWTKKEYETQKEARAQKTTQQNQKPYKDVFREYYQESTPGKGNIDYDENYTKSKDEMNVSKIIHKELGGDIFLFEHTNYNKTSPDYIWNNELWELKSPKGIKGIDGLVRKGLKQIGDNPGGIVIDLKDYPISIDEAIEEATKRIMREDRKYILDLMIIKNGKIKKIIRYN